MRTGIGSGRRPPSRRACRIGWRSESYGAIFMGEAYEYLLPEGVHVVTMSADDHRGGLCAAHVTILVTSL